MRLEEIFEGISRARIGVVGDFCLDAYWLADMKRSELSRETPHFFMPVVQERYSPGGAGNVACNLAALEPARVSVLGVLGDDWRGALLGKSLADRGVDASGLLVDPSRVTNTYIKPQRAGISDVVYEDPRLDFDNYEPLSAATEERLIAALDKLDVDVLCVCDQMRFGCITPAVRGKICELGARGLTVIADSRDRIGEYRDVIVKPNDVEALRAVRELGLTSGGGAGDCESALKALAARTGRPAIVTLGGEGCLVFDNGAVTRVPARKVEPPIDICGAGDTFMSGLACALAAGATLCEAAAAANAASAVTIKKLNMTGTASREEIKEVYKS